MSSNLLSAFEIEDAISANDVQLLALTGQTDSLNQAVDLLATQTDLFASRVVIAMPAESFSSNIGLRLDSSVYLYAKGTNDTLEISEVYSVKNISSVTRSVGSWSNSDGLVFHEESIWERRGDLMGAAINCLIEPFSFATIVEVGEDGALLNSSGYFLVRNRTSAKNLQLKGRF